MQRLMALIGVLCLPGLAGAGCLWAPRVVGGVAGQALICTEYGGSRSQEAHQYYGGAFIPNEPQMAGPPPVEMGGRPSGDLFGTGEFNDIFGGWGDE